MNFTYTARSKTGEKVAGTIEARDKAEALLAIEKRGHVPISITSTTHLHPPSLGAGYKLELPQSPQQCSPSPLSTGPSRNRADSSRSMDVSQGHKCAVCQDETSLYPNEVFEFCAAVGATLNKDELRFSTQNGNFYVGGVFTPLSKCPILMYCCKKCYEQYEENCVKECEAKAAASASSKRRARKLSLIPFGWLVLSIMTTYAFQTPLTFGRVVLLFVLPIVALIILLIGAFGGWDTAPECLSAIETNGRLRFMRYMLKSAVGMAMLQAIYNAIDISSVTFRNVSGGGQSDKEKDLLLIPIGSDLPYGRDLQSHELCTFQGRRWYWDVDPRFGFDRTGEFGTFKRQISGHGEVSLHMATISVEMANDLNG